MKITNYKILISNLPVQQQSFTTKRSTWMAAENKVEWLKNINHSLFSNNETLSLCRQDIFNTQSVRELIIKTIYWGYTGGMRGNHFLNILKKIDVLEECLSSLKSLKEPTINDFNKSKDIFKSIEGLGLSTYSKLLYFLNININNNPSLILDQRLINVFANKTYDEFYLLSDIKNHNAESKYLNYLTLVNQISDTLNCKPENIEQFLFIFGNNLSTPPLDK